MVSPRIFLFVERNVPDIEINARIDDSECYIYLDVSPKLVRFF